MYLIHLTFTLIIITYFKFGSADIILDDIIIWN